MIVYDQEGPLLKRCMSPGDQGEVIRRRGAH